MSDVAPQDLRDLLRQVPYPGTTRNIVSAGFVRGTTVDGAAVTVEFRPNSTDAGKVAAMEGGIKDVLYGAGFALVRVDTEAPYDDTSLLLGTGTMNPLQAELLEDGVDPQPDVLLGDMRRHVPAGAESEPDEPTWRTGAGPLPVLQWEIDPTDPDAPSAQRAVNLDGWEFRVWWQQHRSGSLTYASLQALREDWVDHAGIARSHPVGRTEAVNLVYDATRNAVVAIYGTVRDFRPFVEAFRLAYLAEHEQQGARTEGVTAATPDEGRSPTA